MPLPFDLKQYKLTCIVVGVDAKPMLIKAKTPESAWGKFATLYFGVLKPSPDDWRIDEIRESDGIQSSERNRP